MMVYAEATARELIEVIPFYDALNCDFTAISVAFIRHTRSSGTLGDFQVRGIAFPATNFSAKHLLLLPLVREADGKRTLRPVMDFLQEHDITHLRIVGSGDWNRQHQYSRNGGLRWGNMPTSSTAPIPPAPTTVIDARIPPAPEVTDDAQPSAPTSHPAPAPAGPSESGRPGAAADPTEVTL